MYTIGIILTFLVSSLAWSQDWLNVKTVGGHIGECSTTSSPIPASSLPFNLKIIDEKKTGTRVTTRFEVQFLECKLAKWAPIKKIENEFKFRFTDEIGQNQQETIQYSNFRARVIDKNSKVLQTIKLDTGAQGKTDFTVSVNSIDIEKDSNQTKFVDVTVLADRVRQTSADRFFEEVTWGNFRIQITSKK